MQKVSEIEITIVAFTYHASAIVLKLKTLFILQVINLVRTSYPFATNRINAIDIWAQLPSEIQRRLKPWYKWCWTILQFQGKIPDVNVILLRPPCNLRRDYMDATWIMTEILVIDNTEAAKEVEANATIKWSLSY